MALTTISDSELLLEFRNPVTKEKAFTSIIKKIPGKTILAPETNGCGS